MKRKARLARLGSLRFLALGAISLVAVAIAGCTGGSSEIPGLTQAAVALPDDNAMYRGPKLNTDRYGHTATVLDDGRVVVVGGSDERFLTSLATAEIFDQTLFQEPQPQTISGDFVDTDFEGDPIVMQNGGRIYHTATLLPDGNVLVCGGSADVLIAEATQTSEIFDVQSREFAPSHLQIDDDMVLPRFRHSATVLPNGKVLIVGGQLSLQETIIDPNFPPGSPFFQIDVEVFPSTPTIELFDPSSRSFSLATDLAGNETFLITPRGRAGHGTQTFAGIDNDLGTPDDVLVHTGGYTTLSAIFAPLFKTPGQFVTDKLTGVEYYEPATGINASAQNIFLEPRSNNVVLLNLGEFQDVTPQGVEGVSNIILVTNGDDDRAGSANCFTSVVQSELLVATFTGFGPSNGVQFMSMAEVTQIKNIETVVFNPDLCFPFGRTGAEGVMMANLRIYDDEEFHGNWALTAGGSWLFPTPGGCAEVMFGTCLNEIVGVQLFDPFYNAAVDPPWDLSLTTEALNPTGVIGTWLNADEAIPDNTFDGFADGSPLAALNKERVLHSISVVPGEDGIRNTGDDRLLIVGGGSSFFPNLGDETVSISSEVYLPPGANGPE